MTTTHPGHDTDSAISMSNDMTSSIVEERSTSVTLGSYIEDVPKGESSASQYTKVRFPLPCSIAPPTSDVLIQHSDISRHHNTVIT